MKKAVRKSPKKGRKRASPRRRAQRRRVELLGTVALSLFAAVIAGAFYMSSLQFSLLGSPNVAAVVSAVLVQLANQDRSQHGLQNLTVSPVLVEAAQAKANDMASKGYFAHVSPQGIDPWYWFKQAGYKFDYAGENLAVNFTDSGAVNTAWMNSPEHRANILDPHYTQIGIATAQGMYQGRMTTFVVQEFGDPAASNIQQAVAQQLVPSTPTKIAEATTKKSEVLGSSADAVQKPASSKPVQPAPAAVQPSTTSPALAATLAQQNEQRGVPLWGYFIGFPSDALRYFYYLVAAFLVAALAIETGLELRWHHRKHAVRAGAMLALMAALFVTANSLFFPQPQVPIANASQPAAAVGAVSK